MTDSFDSPGMSNQSAEWSAIVDGIRCRTADHEAVRRVTSRALTLPVSRQRQQLSSRVRRSKRLVVVAAVLMGVGGLSSMLFSHILISSNLAFAEVQEQVARSHSVQYVEFMSVEEAKRELAQTKQRLRETAARLEVASGDYKEKLQSLHEQLQQQIEDYRRKVEKGERIEKRRVQILGRYKQRTEMPSPFGKRIHITDTETGRSITLEPEKKQCIIHKTQTILNLSSGGKTTHEIRPDRTVDFYARIRNVPANATTRVGEIVVKGKTLVGFQSVEQVDSATWTRTYWVDPKTKMPNRIDVEWRNRNGYVTTATADDFVFDAEIDPALFKSQPPDGYTVVEGGFVSVEDGEKKSE